MMAKAAGISLRSVQRIWKAHRLAPHRVRTFKLSKDPAFVPKLRDVVGLYLHPPAHAIVLSVDEKSQIQALDRTQPGLPMKEGRPRDHDPRLRAPRHHHAVRGPERARRHGAGPLHAAPPPPGVPPLPQRGRGGGAGRQAGPRHPRQLRHPQAPQGPGLAGAAPALDLPLHPDLLLVAQRGRDLLRQADPAAPRRGSFPSLVALQEAINRFLEEHNRDPRPFVWTADPDAIVEKVRRGITDGGRPGGRPGRTAMAASRVERRLAAILAADVVGYSRLIERGRGRHARRAQGCAARLVDPLLAEHRGRIVKLMGDGALVEFGSVVDAVACAVAIQQAVAEREAEVPAGAPDPVPDRRQPRRRGRRGRRRPLGDGVNVAARLEQLCRAGRVLVSGTAYDHLQGKLDLRVRVRGEQRLKNIERPVRVYRMVVGGPGAASRRRPRPAARRPDQPSLAVLPFANMSGDPEQELLRRRHRRGPDHRPRQGLRAVRDRPPLRLRPQGGGAGRARGGARLGVRYVLEGSVRRAGERVRITAQLVDAATGAHLWAERYDRVWPTCSWCRRRWSSASSPRSRSAAARRGGGDPPGRRPATWRPTSSTCAAGSCSVPARQALPGLARRLFAQAAALDPGFARAHAGIAECDANLHLHYGGRLPVEEILAGAEAALALEPGLAAAHVARGVALVAQGRIEEAERGVRAGDRARAGQRRRPSLLRAPVLPAGADGGRRAAVPPGRGAVPRRHLRAADPGRDRAGTGAGRGGPRRGAAHAGAGRTEARGAPRGPLRRLRRRDGAGRPGRPGRARCGWGNARSRSRPTTT